MIKAVIFDLDGTVTVPPPDFMAIRRDIGVPEGSDILGYVKSLEGEKREEAEKILDGHEEETALTNRLNNGARELLAYLADNGIPTAIVTRNSRHSVNLCRDRHKVSFDFVATRDDPPPKPDPVAVYRIAEKLGFEPENAMVVGDYLFDIQLGKAAGCFTALVKNSRVPPFEAEPDYEIDALDELIPIIEKLNCRPG